MRLDPGLVLGGRNDRLDGLEDRRRRVLDRGADGPRERPVSEILSVETVEYYESEHWWIDPLTDSHEALRARVAALEAENERLRERQKEIALAFHVPDGGAYFNDFLSRAEIIDRAVAERDAALARVKELEEVIRDHWSPAQAEEILRVHKTCAHGILESEFCQHCPDGGV